MGESATTRHRRAANPRTTGLLLAALTAIVSGFAVFFNGYGVRAWSEITDPTAYTTIKNLVAAIVVGAVAAVAHLRRRREPERSRLTGSEQRRLAAVAVVGGSIPFALFFEGLARASSVQAAVIHKSLLIWVAIAAPLILKERVRAPHLLAIGLLVAGQILLAGELTTTAFGPGEWMILAATLLWTVEVVVAKRLLAGVSSTTVAAARMIGGTALLGGWLAVRGVSLDFAGLTTTHLVWIIVAGGFLSAYVLTWFAALALAPALDVTAVLVAGAVITALLQTTVQGAALASPAGLMLLVAGAGLLLAWPGRTSSPAADR